MLSMNLMMERVEISQHPNIYRQHEFSNLINLLSIPPVDFGLVCTHSQIETGTLMSDL